MSKLKRGQIVLVRFPFVNEGKTKIRPALVLEDTMDDDVLGCRITGQFHKSPFDININDWKKSGLLMPSVIRVHKIATIDKTLIRKTIGLLEPDTVMEVNNRL